MPGSRDEDYLGVWPALEDEGVGLCDVTSSAPLMTNIDALVFWPSRLRRMNGRWDPPHPPGNWKQARNRWEFFQGLLRSWMLPAGFVLTRAGLAIS